jgi:hypothetical protein
LLPEAGTSLSGIFYMKGSTNDGKKSTYKRHGS